MLNASTFSLFSLGFFKKSPNKNVSLAESSQSSSDPEVHCSGGALHQHCRYLSSA